MVLGRFSADKPYHVGSCSVPDTRVRGRICRINDSKNDYHPRITERKDTEKY